MNTCTPWWNVTYHSWFNGKKLSSHTIKIRYQASNSSFLCPICSIQHLQTQSASVIQMAYGTLCGWNNMLHYLSPVLHNRLTENSFYSLRLRFVVLKPKKCGGKGATEFNLELHVSCNWATRLGYPYCRNAHQWNFTQLSAKKKSMAIVLVMGPGV